MIESFAFGSMTVDGRTYSSDLIIYPDGRVADNWWRTRGHRLALADIRDLVAAEPRLIVVGTGIYGLMKPDADLLQTLARKGIEVVAARNKKAVTIFNKRMGGKKTGACFHLSC